MTVIHQQLERLIFSHRSVYLSLLLLLATAACSEELESTSSTEMALGGSSSGGSEEDPLSAGTMNAGEAFAGTINGGAQIAGEVVAGDTNTTGPTTEDIYQRLRPSCVNCHGDGFALPYFATLNRFQSLLVADVNWVVAGQPEASALLDLLRGMSSGTYSQMPPGDSPYSESIAGQNGAPSMLELEEWILGLGNDPIEIEEELPCATTPTRGVMTRLSKLEYGHAIRDLLGTALDVGEGLPDENESYGFAHIASLLTLSPLLVEKYDLAAEALALEAVPSHAPPTEVQIFEAENDLTSMVGRATGEFWNLWSNGTLSTFTSVPFSAEYDITVTVSGQQAGPDPTRFSLVIDGEELPPQETSVQTPTRESFTTSVQLTAGEHQVGIRFLNDYYCPQDRFDEGECSGLGDRNLLVDRLTITGPLTVDLPPSSFEVRYLTCTPEEGEAETCLRATLNRFGRLAWRRPLTDTELDRLWDLISAEMNGEVVQGWRTGLRQAIHAMLLSPHFIFRVERAPAGQALNAYERATRLAAFLWRSIPDELLLDAAERGDLDSQEGIRMEVTRMLNDRKATALVNDFGGRWMQLHHLDGAAPDYATCPQFNEELNSSMREEAERVLTTIVDEGRSILDLVNADFTWIDQRLADFYGLTDALDPNREQAFQRVSLPQGGRLGFLTQAAWLTLTSQPTRTSPVVRGKWVLENLLCAPPPPPPPSVEGLPETGVDQDASVRERFEQHRADPACAACHTHMDAIGFGFEQFSGIGEFRLMDGRDVVDPSGELPTTPPTTFNDAVELVQTLRADPALPRCVTERMVIYALGRGVGEEERCMVDDVMSQSGRLSLQELAQAIAGSIMMTTQGVER